MPYKDPAKRKERNVYYYEKNKDKIKENSKKYYEQNEEQKKEYSIKRLEDQRQNAYDSIKNGKIIERKKWDMWCNDIKRAATKNKHPYSDDFTNDIVFDLMVQGCFYCGQLATTIDRLDSKLDHTPDNCVASCHGCNMSKGAADSSTFIRKAYYRVRGEYVDGDNDIWFVNKTKPNRAKYKSSANKKKVPFDLSKEDWDKLIKGDCEYCKRSPDTWFGVDRVIPTLGYVHGNVASCCFDCNLDKLEDDVESMMKRNERIAARVDCCDLVADQCEKVILHTGMQTMTKKSYADTIP